jgi:hypothetical protein
LLTRSIWRRSPAIRRMDAVILLAVSNSHDNCGARKADDLQKTDWCHRTATAARISRATFIQSKKDKDVCRLVKITPATRGDRASVSVSCRRTDTARPYSCPKKASQRVQLVTRGSLRFVIPMLAKRNNSRIWRTTIRRGAKQGERPYGYHHSPELSR